MALILVMDTCRVMIQLVNVMAHMRWRVLYKGAINIDRTRGCLAGRGEHIRQLAVPPKHRWSRIQPSHPRQE